MNLNDDKEEKYGGGEDSTKEDGETAVIDVGTGAQSSGEVAVREREHDTGNYL